MAWAVVVGAGVGLVGAAMSADAAGDQADAARETSATADARAVRTETRVNEAMAKLAALTPPNLLQYIQPYQKQVVAGTLSPEEAVFKMQQDTAYAGIKVPQALLDAQRLSLNSIQKIANEGGMTAQTKASLNDIEAQQAARSKAEQGAIIQDAQQRGVGGSGIEIASRLLSQQQGANRAAAGGLQVAADAEARRLAAITQAGTMATSQRAQEVSEQQKAAEAQDMINKFNTSFQNSTDATNVAARNSAAATNLANAQRVADNNAEVARMEAAARQAAAQQQWQNTFNQQTNLVNAAGGQAGQALTANAQAQNLAQQQQAQAAALNAAAITQATEGIGSLVDAYGNYTTKKTGT